MFYSYKWVSKTLRLFFLILAPCAAQKKWKWKYVSSMCICKYYTSLLLDPIAIIMFACNYIFYNERNCNFENWFSFNSLFFQWFFKVPQVFYYFPLDHKISSPKRRKNHFYLKIEKYMVKNNYGYYKETQKKPYYTAGR